MQGQAEQAERGVHQAAASTEESRPEVETDPIKLFQFSDLDQDLGPYPDPVGCAFIWVRGSGSAFRK